jgi:hypothetical protein
MVGTLAGLLSLVLLGMIAAGDRSALPPLPPACDLTPQAARGPTSLSFPSRGNPSEGPCRKVREYLDDDREDEGPLHHRDRETLSRPALPTRKPATLLYAKLHRAPIAAGLTAVLPIDALCALLI